MKPRYSLSLCASIMSLGSVLSWAQDDVNDELAKQKEQAELQAAIVTKELELAKAEAELERLKFGASSTLGTGGSVTTKDGAGYYGRLLSYHSLRKTAEIVIERAELEGKSVLVTSDFELAKLSALAGRVRANMSKFSTELDALAALDPEKVVEALLDVEESEYAIGTGLAVLGAAADVASFFQLKREISGFTLEPSNDVLHAEIARKLLIESGNPILVDIALSDGSQIGEWITESITTLGKVDRVRAALADKIQVQTLDARVTEAKAKLSMVQPGSVEHDSLTTQVEHLNAQKNWWSTYSQRYQNTSAELNAFIKSLATPVKGKSKAPMEELYFFDLLEGQSDDALILLVKVVSQGGDVETSSGTLRSSKISYLGGSVCVYHVLTSKGTLVGSGAIPVVAAQSFKGRIGNSVPIEVDGLVLPD